MGDCEDRRLGDASRVEATAIQSDEAVLTCLVTDDHPLVRGSLAVLLTCEGMSVAGLAGTAAETLRLLEWHRPAVAVVDYRLPDLDGIELARRAASVAPETRVILYTSYADRALVRKALDAGVHGVVLKQGRQAALLRAISIVSRGGTYVDPAARKAAYGPPRAYAA
jgi:DNA-binding NarL/FixJ family response regulator